MRRFTAHLIVGLLTFLVGLSAVVWFARGPDVCSCMVEVTGAQGKPAHVSSAAETNELPAEAPEAKAVRLAEEFVARNGYTDLPADKNALAHETIEWTGDVDELLESRRDTLERKPYGVQPGPKHVGQPGWAVVFRYKKPLDSSMRKHGRAVTMDEDFQNMRVEHADFILDRVGKKL